MEIWKDIKDYEGRYQVSNLGRVKSLERVIKRPKKVGCFVQKERILKPSKCKGGYMGVTLVIDKKKKRHLVHRLVAIAFIKNPNSLKYVNHIDAKRDNNKAKNLEWCTQSENKKHSYNLGLSNKKGTNHHLSKFTESDIIDIRRKYEQEGLLQKTIAKEYNVSKATIWHIVNYKTWNYDIKKIGE